MAQILKGKEVVSSLVADTTARVEALKAGGIEPTLAIVRVGENPGDLSYEKGAVKRAEKIGITVKKFVLDAMVTQAELEDTIKAINADDSIHGVLMFRPLPRQINEKEVCELLDPAKDMDGITTGSMAGIFMDTDMGYPPCTAEACIEVLKYYGYDLTGKKVTVMGRSLVIGKPVAMMAMRGNATVTVCHSRTTPEDFAAAGRGADIVIAALGKAKMVGPDKLGQNQVIIDVGINMDENDKLCGDVDYDAVEPLAAAITPVPGGVGGVTTAILMKHVVEAAEKVS